MRQRVIPHIPPVKVPNKVAAAVVVPNAGEDEEDEDLREAS